MKQGKPYSSSLGLFVPANILSMLVISDKIKLNKRAFQKLFTVNSGISFVTSIIIKAFITKRKKPRVKKVIGIVKIVKIGLTTVFKKAKTTATNKAVIKSLTSTPGSNAR